jgi:hypothetical protein
VRIGRKLERVVKARAQLGDFRTIHVGFDRHYSAV